MNPIKTTSISEYRLPDTMQLERQVLTDAVTSPEAIGEMMRYLTAEAFTGDKRPHLWQTIADLYARGEAVDIITMHAREGAAFTDEVIAPSLEGSLARGAINHALLLRNAQARRRAYFAAVKLLEASTKQENGEADLCAMADTISRQVEIGGSVSERPLAAVLDNINAGMKERRTLAEQGKLYRVPTGFEVLDWNTYKGWGPGQLIILAARPSVGKTAIMLQMAKAAAGAGFPATIFSLEMTEDELGQRLMFSTGKVAPADVACGRVDDAQFTDATEGLRGLPIYINDHSRTMEEIIARMTIETRAGKCRVAFVDYLGLMDISTGWRESLNQAIGKITGELKATAKRLKIPIILLCQLNRDAARADRAPELYDLRDSGSIEQDADIVMMLETDEAIEPTTGLHDINIWLRKNRQYKKDICIKVRPNKTYSHFDEISVETPEVVTEEVAEDDDDTDDYKLF